MTAVRTPRAHDRNSVRSLGTGIVVLLGLCLGIGLSPGAPAAYAQTPSTASPRPTPMLTVADPQIPRCGAITATGSAFAPNSKIVMVVSGKTMAERPTSDESGNFSFTTSVPCEQASGTVQVRAFDGTAAVTVEVAIGADRPTTTLETIDPTPTAGRFDLWTLTAARVLLLTIAAVELVVLFSWRRRRAQRRLTPLDARPVNSHRPPSRPAARPDDAGPG